MKERKKNKNKINRNIYLIIILTYFVFVIYSYFFDIPSGIEISNNLISFLLYMMKILPCAFILIGLFETWVSREKVEKHLGHEGGLRGYVWAIILAGTMGGGLLVALPVSSALYNKGARLSVIFTFVGASAIVRIPMTLFEASFLGIEFTAIRWFISIPLIIIFSIFLERYLSKQNYSMKSKS
jgi:uncharacterized membrane protein YraQ (UPF0718 family)